VQLNLPQSKLSELYSIEFINLSLPKKRKRNKKRIHNKFIKA
jgi:hypothetical protein